MNLDNARAEPMKIVFITTGGTIDKIYFDRKNRFEVGDPQMGEMLCEANVTLDYEIIPLLQKDSLDFGEADRRLILETVRKSPHRHFVITHGTDTIIETGRVLLEAPGNTIVLTGAMQPARFRFTDAVFNIGTAVSAVQFLDQGVYIAMNGRIFRPENAWKNVEKNRFEEI
ncbi:MAG: asparaginase domain-containing protein [Desulfobacteraceae bacterium]